MKLTCIGSVLLCLVTTTGLAQPSTQSVARVLPTRINAAPAPPLPPPPVTVTPRPRTVTLPPAPQPVHAYTPPAPLANTILAWDAEMKEYNLKPGETQAHFTFYFTNVSSENVLITSAAASCGCTVPKLPSVPWTNAPGASGEIPVTMNVAGKSGMVFKTVTVSTDKGSKTLTVKANIPPPEPVANLAMDRNKNQELAKADRQAVFKGDCARCHVEPARGKFGKDLYDKACGICHESEHRASMVPNLHALNHDTNADYWKTWISQGKPNSLMPAFALSQGGPLTDAEIASLVQYLSATIPAHSQRTAQAEPAK